MSVFCEKCRDIVAYSLELVNREKEIKGIKIKFEERKAYCTKCGEELFVPEIRDNNLKMLDDKYREEKGLITVEEINDILQKYNIGKRPLSTLLGWGEGTLTRYVDGDMPTKAYSDTLKQIYSDSFYFLKLLEERKDKIADVTYIRSKNALELLHKTGSKLDSAIKYLLNQTTDVTPLALQKLLYYTQCFYKAFSDTFLFEEDCEAWKHGPVYKDIYHQYKGYGHMPIEKNEVTFKDIDLTENEKELLDQIIKSFGCYSGKVLEKMTHSEKPWRIAREGLSEWESSNEVIKKSDIAEYFSGIKEEYNMLSPADITNYASALFDRVYSQL